MDSPITNIDELLSGMLDGMLSEADLVELKREMAENPSLQGRLDDLAVLRRSLLIGRSPSLLGPDFAISVTLAARKRAAEMGSDAPAWLASPDSLVLFPKSLAPSSVDSGPWRRWIFAGGLTLAATLLFVLISMPKADRPRIVTIPVGGEKIAVVDTADIPEVPGIPEAPEAKKLLVENSEKILVAEADSTPLQTKKDPVQSVARVAAVVLNTQPLGTLQADAVVVNPKDKPTGKANEEKSSLAASSNESQNSKSTDRSLEEVLNYAKTKLGPDFSTTKFLALVVDISVNKKAIENHTLESILNRHDIASTENQILNLEQFMSLENSQLTGNAKAAGSEEIGVMFVRAPANKLNLAIVDISNEQEAFPDFSMDLSADNSLRVLVKELSNIRFATGNVGESRHLAHTQSGNTMMSFKASPRKAGLFSRDSIQSVASTLLTQESRQLANTLIIIRASR